jgi:hypothetical protein
VSDQRLPQGLLHLSYVLYAFVGEPGMTNEKLRSLYFPRRKPGGQQDPKQNQRGEPEKIFHEDVSWLES